MPGTAKRPQKKRKALSQAKKSGIGKEAVPEKEKLVDGTLLSPRFKLIFTFVTRITFICLIGYIGLGIAYLFLQPDSVIFNGLLETLKSTFTLGFGSILGLLDQISN